MSLKYIPAQDPEVAAAIDAELARQRGTIELIASENFVSMAVLEAAGTVLTNKYAEGLPGKRYYGGCEKVDIVENLARDRACELFGADHANVQPHAGAQANLAVYYAALDPGDTVLGMNLAMGGHLTHGSPVNFSGKWFNVVPYGLDMETETIDYDEMERLAKEHRPKMIIAGASAYPRVIDFERFADVAKQVGAVLMVDMAHIAGLVATGAHPSPVPYADFVTSTSHKTLRGPRSGFVLCKEEWAVKLDKAVFPGLQGGPLEHIIAAKAVAFGEAQQAGVLDLHRPGRHQRAGHGRGDGRVRPAARSPAAPTTTSCSWTCGRPASPARTPSDCSRTSASPPTRTRSPTTPRARSSRAASGSARRP